MANVQKTNKAERVITVSLILITLGVATILIIGTALKKANIEVVTLDKYIVNAEIARPNFEQSLIEYTQKTKTIIEYLLKLRPGSEEEYIKFISVIEDIGLKLSLEIDLQSIKNQIIQGGIEKNYPTYGYKISFFGSMDELDAFLEELEKTPYLIKIDELSYLDLNDQMEKDKVSRNITLKIKLFLKEKNEKN